MSATATFDALTVGVRLQDKLQDFSRGEVQLFCYLSCLLSLYDGNPTVFWTYNFIKNKYGSPYSSGIDEAIEASIARGTISEKSDGFLNVTDTGLKLQNTLGGFHINQHRLKYIGVALDTILSIPFGDVRDAINNEPILKNSRNINETRILNDEQSATIEVLYQQFHNLKLALQDKYENLAIPSLVWINYLIKTHKATTLS